MSVCKNLKGYTRRHTWLADLFSLMAAILFFGSIYLGFAYHTLILGWVSQDYILYTPLAVGTMILDVFLIFFFLNVGSARLADEDEGCFHTFKGRRAGSGSAGMMFTSWLRHMEHVGKKHR
ncbi:MAG: cell division protein BolA [Pseudomonadota bacterium]